MDQTVVVATGIRFSIKRANEEVGRAYLYLIKNDLHDKPFGLLEDVYVHTSYRGQGIAGELLDAVLKKASEACYKLIATSRDDGTRTDVHAWYERLGFKNYGREFRINF